VASIDLFRLPPILTPLLTDEKVPYENSGSQAIVCGAQCDKMKRSDGLSSVEPDVDSSLSSLPSDSSSVAAIITLAVAVNIQSQSQVTSLLLLRKQ
jgi:hypothetical protein